MRRGPKSFVVEVKRGARRSSPFGSESFNEPMSEAARQAERALFSAPAGTAAKPKPAGAAPGRRILESLVEPPAAFAATSPVETGAEDAAAPRRRGRKPGSRNRPRVPSAPATEPAARGAAAEPVPHARAHAEPATSGPEPSAAAEPAQAVEAVHSGAELGEGARRRERFRHRSTILARYVLGSEPLPGERWTSPLRRAARRRRGPERESAG